MLDPLVAPSAQMHKYRGTCTHQSAVEAKLSALRWIFTKTVVKQSYDLLLSSDHHALICVCSCSNALRHVTKRDKPVHKPFLRLQCSSIKYSSCSLGSMLVLELMYCVQYLYITGQPAFRVHSWSGRLDHRLIRSCNPMGTCPQSPSHKLSNLLHAPNTSRYLRWHSPMQSYQARPQQ